MIGDVFTLRTLRQVAKPQRRKEYEFFAAPRLCVFATSLLVGGLTFQTASAVASDQIPGGPQDRPIALVGATVHPVVGDVVARGTVLFDKGKIVAVGRDVKLPKNAVTIDAQGKHVYPGLIDADTDVGLVEVMAVRATVDDSETGSINPNARAQTAVNPDSEWIPVTRANGVLTVMTAPTGSLLSGLGTVLNLDGWTWEDMTVRADSALFVNWPILQVSHTWRLEEAGPVERTRGKVVEQLTAVFADARSYMRLKQARADEKRAAPDYDARWEAMIPVLEGKTPMFIRADDVRQIQSAVAFARKEGVKLVIVGGYDAAACAELLRAEDVPVVIKGVNRLPRQRHDAYDEPFTLAARLYKAGVKFCISANDRMANFRNLPYHAAAAASYGLPVEEALKSITQYPAEILGVADRLGSLEPGKDATLIVTTGDPLEIATNVTAAFIQGRKVDLSSRHTDLWHKYQEKYRQIDAYRGE